MDPLILGVSDSIADDFDKEAYKAKNGPEKIDALLGAAVNRLFDFLEFHPHAARELITDLIASAPR